MMEIRVIILTLVSATFTLSHLTLAVNPGLRLRLSQPGLNYASQVAVDVLTQKVKGTSLPDQSGKYSIKICKIHYDVKNMHVTGFARPTVKVTVSPSKVITWSMTNAGVSVHGDWKYKCSFVHDRGSFDASADGISISIGVSLGMDAKGQPTIRSTGCSGNVNKVKVKFHGGASWLYNLFSKNVEKPLRSALNSDLCKVARDAIDDSARKQLAKLRLHVVIDKKWEFDYQLVAPPSYSTSYLESYHKGEFFLSSNRSEAPFAAPTFPVTATTERMVTFWISDYVLNTAGYVLYRQNILKTWITKKVVPDEFKDYFNTSCTLKCFGKIIPALGKLYPNASVEIYAAAGDYPRLNISSVINGFLMGTMTFNVRLANGSSTYLFNATVSAKLDLNVTLVDYVFKANVQRLIPSIKVTSSSIGPISDVVLNLVFNYALKASSYLNLMKWDKKDFPFQIWITCSM